MRLSELFTKRKDAPELLPLLCCICMFVVDPDKEQPNQADTILNGHAVCMKHVYIVRDNTFMRRVAHAQQFAHNDPLSEGV